MNLFPNIVKGKDGVVVGGAEVVSQVVRGLKEGEECRRRFGVEHDKVRGEAEVPIHLRLTKCSQVKVPKVTFENVGRVKLEAGRGAGEELKVGLLVEEVPVDGE